MDKKFKVWAGCHFCTLVLVDLHTIPREIWLVTGQASNLMWTSDRQASFQFQSYGEKSCLNLPGDKIVSSQSVVATEWNCSSLPKPTEFHTQLKTAMRDVWCAGLDLTLHRKFLSLLSILLSHELSVFWGMCFPKGCVRGFPQWGLWRWLSRERAGHTNMRTCFQHPKPTPGMMPQLYSLCMGNRWLLIGH